MNLDQSMRNILQKKGIALSTHLRPLPEIFSEEQLETTPIDNKVGENYLGQMTDQLHRKGGTAFKAIGERYSIFRGGREDAQG